MKAFFDMMHEGPHKVMLFGAACTQVTDPIAKASKHWRITQVNNNLTFDLTHYTIMYLLNITNIYRYPAFKMFKLFVRQKCRLLYKCIYIHDLYFTYNVKSKTKLNINLNNFNARQTAKSIKVVN